MKFKKCNELEDLFATLVANVKIQLDRSLYHVIHFNHCVLLRPSRIRDRVSKFDLKILCSPVGIDQELGSFQHFQDLGHNLRSLRGKSSNLNQI